MSSAARPAYQDPASTQTLAAALEEYYAVNAAKFARPQSLPAESEALFRSHDLCHVIFGLSTSLEDEGVVDMRTVIGSDVGWRRYLRYLASDPEAKRLMAELGWVRSTLITLRVLPRVARAAWQRLGAPKPWPWTPPPELLDRSLADLRREFGIRLV